jgi:hypothetical protein
LNAFYANFGILVEAPLLALIPAAILLCVGYVRRSRLAQIAGVVWFIYALYELAIRARLLCSGECNIRVDLLVIYPALALLSLVAVVAVLRMRSEPRA